MGDVESTVNGARGSHMCAVADLDLDGSDEVLWEERAVRLDSAGSSSAPTATLFEGALM